METSTILTPGRLALIALANEYCQALENVPETGLGDFVASMTRLLPRLYMAASDLQNPVVTGEADEDDVYLEEALDESRYDSVRRSIEALVGADDVYLETFESDMKYSDTPIGASISESLADLFQELYNFTDTVRNARVEMIPAALAALKDDFETYWSQTLCNVMRPLNNLRYNIPDEDAD